MATVQRVTTAVELSALSVRDDGQRRYELVAGELAVMSPTKPRHGRVVLRLTLPLGEYILARGLGEVYGAETGFQLAHNPDTVRAPDFAFVRRERVLAVGDTSDWWPGAPDLAAEVLSPDDRPREVQRKVNQWLAAGTRLVLVVDPHRRVVTVHRPGQEARELAEADTINGEEVVPGWSLPVARLFAAMGETGAG